MDTIAPVEQPPLTAPSTPTDSPTVPTWARVCLNCQAALSGPFCSECGQRAVPPHPRLAELAGDALAEFSGWDGKFAETIRLLVRQPGELTRQFIAGGRVRFISPVRLYLAMSFVYFVLAGAVAQRTTKTGEVNVAGISISATSDQVRGPGAVAAAERSARRGQITAAERDSALAAISHAPAVVRPLLRRGLEDPNGLREALMAYMPRIFFALLPVFAGILALFYRKRYYPEHLYFAIHLHAFAFFALMLVELVRLARLDAVASSISPLVFIWVCVYTVLALRQVYGGSLRATVAKGAGIGALYLIASGITLLGMVVAVALIT